MYYSVLYYYYVDLPVSETAEEDGVVRQLVEVRWLWFDPQLY